MSFICTFLSHFFPSFQTRRVGGGLPSLPFFPFCRSSSLLLCISPTKLGVKTNMYKIVMIIYQTMYAASIEVFVAFFTLSTICVIN